MSRFDSDEYNSPREREQRILDRETGWTPDTEARPEEPRTTTGTWLIAMHPELARLTTGRVVNEANEYVVPVIEAEAAALRESEVRAELRERVAGLTFTGSVWRRTYRPAVLALFDEPESQS